MIAEGIAGMGLRNTPDGSLRPEFDEWSHTYNGNTERKGESI